MFDVCMFKYIVPPITFLIYVNLNNIRFFFFVFHNFLNFSFLPYVFVHSIVTQCMGICYILSITVRLNAKNSIRNT